MTHTWKPVVNRNKNLILRSGATPISKATTQVRNQSRGYSKYWKSDRKRVTLVYFKVQPELLGQKQQVRMYHPPEGGRGECAATSSFRKYF